MVGSENQRWCGHRQLTQRHHEQCQARQRQAAARSDDPAPASDEHPLHHPLAQIGDDGCLAQPVGPAHRLRPGQPLPATDAAGQVRVERLDAQLAGRLLTVQPGRQRFSRLLATHHTPIVDACPQKVPAAFLPSPSAHTMGRMEPLGPLAAAAATGDRDAARTFVQATQVDLWRLTSHLVDQASAADLVQETYLRAWPALRTLRADSNIRAWLATIAYRVCADEIRRRQRHRRRLDRLASQPPTIVPEHTPLDDLLGGLSPDRRAAFVLTQVLGYSYQEAAQACDVPVGTIRSRVARARSDLAALLAEPAAGDPT